MCSSLTLLPHRALAVGHAATTQTPRPPVHGDLVDCQVLPDGFYASHRSCSEYFICAGGSTYTVECADSLVFNADTGFCDWPRNYECSIGVTSQPTTASPAETTTVTSEPTTMAQTPRPTTTEKPSTTPMPTTTVDPATVRPTTVRPTTTRATTERPTTTRATTVRPTTTRATTVRPTTTRATTVRPTTTTRKPTTAAPVATAVSQYNIGKDP